MTDRWFDAHLDLAYITECGRDMHAGLDDCRGRSLPAAVTLPSLREGGVQACLGTIFTAPAESTQDRGPFEYEAGDAEAAHIAGLRQLKLYQAWARGGVVTQFGSPRQPDTLHLGILMECADPIREPEELRWWASEGVVAVGMAWMAESRYAGGNATDTGLTDAGRELVRVMDEVNVVHDGSHLCQRAIDDLFEVTDTVVIASHSNCRELIRGDNERHLSDATIREIARRGGVIGLNIYRAFISPSGDTTSPATIDDCIAHVEHICEVAGNRLAVGLGSDADGGFDATGLVDGIDEPRDYRKLAEALAARGWSEDEIVGFRWGNWARFWSLDQGVASAQ